MRTLLLLNTGWTPSWKLNISPSIFPPSLLLTSSPLSLPPSPLLPSLPLPAFFPISFLSFFLHTAGFIRILTLSGPEQTCWQQWALGRWHGFHSPSSTISTYLLTQRPTCEVEDTEKEQSKSRGCKSLEEKYLSPSFLQEFWKWTECAV